MRTYDEMHKNIYDVFFLKLIYLNEINQDNRNKDM